MHRFDIKTRKASLPTWFARIGRLKAGKQSPLGITLAIITGIAGAYLLLLAQSPAIINTLSSTPSAEETAEVIASYQEAEINAIIIPKINVHVPILEGGEEALNLGAWHRKPEQGNPTSASGNFIVTAHRFTMGFSPAATAEKSPFYNLHKLSDDDEIIIIWNGEKYYYAVSEIFEVSPSQVEIEDQTSEKVLTLYSCTLQGHADGRLVIRARPLA